MRIYLPVTLICLKKKSSCGTGVFDGTGRQREAMTALYEKVNGMNLRQPNELANMILHRISANLSRGESIDILLHLLEYHDYDMQRCRRPINVGCRYMTIHGKVVPELDRKSNFSGWQTEVYG